MKNIIYIILFINILTASSLSVTVGRDDGDDYMYLSIDSNNEIICKKNLDFFQKEIIVCKSKGFDENITVHREFEFFSLKVDEYKNVVLYPKYNSLIFSRETEIYNLNKFSKNKPKHIDIFFFKNKPTFLINNNIKNRLNFKIDFIKNKDTFIEVLNEKLLPVDSSRDAHKLDFIKSLFEKKDFVSLIKKADDEIRRRNIYESDILLLKIRAINELLKDKKEKDYGYKDLEISSNCYIDMYPSNKHLSEVFYYKVLSLYKQGKYKTASPIVDMLKVNFKNDYFAQKSQILKAKNLFNRKKYSSLAYKILKDLLYNTKDINIALESAYELVGAYLNDKDSKNATLFLDKILKYDESYILKNRNKSYIYAKKFASLNAFTQAVKIAQILEKDSSDEELAKNLAFWQERANMKDLAYKNYKRYLKDYPNGRYTNFIKERLDKVLIDINDTNSSKIDNIEEVMRRYPNDPIYKKAFIKKLDLLMEKQEYDKILRLEDKIRELNVTQYIDKASKKIFDKHILNSDCLKAVNMVDRYKIRVNKDNLYKLAQCYFQLARYKDAFGLAKKYIGSQKSDDLKKWYILSIKSLVKLSNYGKAIEYYNELLKLEKENANLPKDLYYDIFYSYFKLKYIDKALDIVKKIEQKYPKDPKLLDLYYNLVKYYSSEKIDLSIQYYAKKLITLEKELKVDIYSPMVDILLIKALNKLGQYKEALKYFSDVYLSKNITDTQKAQLLYLAGEISLKMKKVEQAREFFIKCGTDVKSDMWQKLCSESLKLIEE